MGFPRVHEECCFKFLITYNIKFYFKDFMKNVAESTKSRTKSSLLMGFQRAYEEYCSKFFTTYNIKFNSKEFMENVS